jgi:sugar diacid utilization regulator
VRRFDHLPLRELVLHLAASDLQPLLPSWRQDLLAADLRLGGSLLSSLRAYADADMNLLKAAARLEAHPNTLYARFARIRELSGLDPLTFRGLDALLLAAEAG